MADVPSTWPDNYVELIDQQTPSHIEQKVGPEYGKLSLEIWGVVFDMKNNILTILNSPEVKENPQKEIQELKSEVGWELIWEAKEQFIQKLQDLPDYEWSKVKEAVEKQTIEIKKIPGRDVYALYESSEWNLVYITNLDWSWYTNVDYFREKPFFEDGIVSWYKKQWYKEVIFNKKTWLWQLYNNKWEDIHIYSDEYMTATLNAINTMWKIDIELRKEAQKRGIKQKWL